MPGERVATYGALSSFL